MNKPAKLALLAASVVATFALLAFQLPKVTDIKTTDNEVA